MISRLFYGLFFLLFSFSASAQTDTGKNINTKLIKVRNDIYMLQGKGGNIGLSFGNDGIFMIDDQYAEGIEQIQKDIKKKSDKPVRFLINTHFHPDHTGGNAAMAQTGAIIVSQENVRDRLKGAIKEETTKIPDEALPMVTFKEDLTFYFNGEKIYVFHVHNAHTDGDSMIYFTRSNVLHAGDVFFNGTYPFIDVAHGGSLKGYIQALEQALLVINEDTKIIPGHGNVGTYRDLENTINMLSTIYKRVYSNYVNNRTEEQILNMPSITEAYDAQGYGEGFIGTQDFLKMIYVEIAKERQDVKNNELENQKAREKIEKMKEEYERKKKG